MNINFSYKADPTPTGIVRVIAYKASDPGTEVTRVEFEPPHINPRDVSLYVPSPVVHIVRIYETPDSESVGVLKAEYVATPSFDGPIVIPPMMIKVGGGRDGTESGGNGAVDPEDGADGVGIEAIAGYTISWVEQRGAGPLKGAAEVVGLDPSSLEWLPRTGGGIDLQNGKKFYDGEEYWIYFEPTLDGNVSAAIQDITDLLEAHINNTNNPHGVTKTQVGLGNLPNAKSDDIDRDDSNTLATSKAVNDLRSSIQNKIAGTGQAHIGNIGAVVANGNVGSVVNQGGNSSAVTITHNLNIVGNYQVIGGFLSNAANYMSDATVTWAWKNAGANSFALIMRETAGATQDVYFYFTLVKI